MTILVGLLQVTLFCVFAYIIGKGLAITYENENKKLKLEMAYIKKERQKEKEVYEERIHMMNDAFDQFKKGQK